MAWLPETATALRGGQVLLMGWPPVETEEGLRTETYDAGPGGVRRLAPSDGSRVCHATVALKDGRALVTGGIHESGDATACALYDPARDRWSRAASLRSGRESHSASLLPDGRVLVAGGDSWKGSVASDVRDVEVYDPGRDEWSDAPACPEDLTHGTALTLSDRWVLVVDGVRRLCAVYDVVARGWGPMVPLPVCVTAGTVTALTDGRALLTGEGPDGPGGAAIFDAGSGRSRLVPGPDGRRLFHTATRLSSGKVLVAGGQGDAGFLQSSTIYDPTTETWHRTADLPMPFFRHHAASLPDGRVLLLGYPDHAQCKALFDPRLEEWTLL